MIYNTEDKINFFISKNPCLEGFNFQKIEGGKNNKGYLLKNKLGKKYFLKEYFSSKTDERNRLKIEWDFLDFIKKTNNFNFPKTIIKDESLNLALFSFIEGQKISNNEITEKHINQVADFIISINSLLDNNYFPNMASDYNCSIHSFIETLDIRIKKLSFATDIDLKLKNKLIILKKKIIKLWDIEKLNINNEFSYDEIKTKTPLFLSPSDIGFHNILMNNGRLFFLDFEYSGLDDLVKLVNDFFTCPSAKIPFKFKQKFISRLMSSLAIDNFFIKRIFALERSYKIKWSCILLNDYLIHSKDRRIFSENKYDHNISSDQYNRSYDLLLS